MFEHLEPALRAPWQQLHTRWTEIHGKKASSASPIAPAEVKRRLLDRSTRPHTRDIFNRTIFTSPKGPYVFDENFCRVQPATHADRIFGWISRRFERRLEIEEQDEVREMLIDATSVPPGSGITLADLPLRISDVDAPLGDLVEEFLAAGGRPTDLYRLGIYGG